jgi:hypothetical protein
MLQEGITDVIDPLKLDCKDTPLVNFLANPEEGLLVNFSGLRLEYYLLRGKSSHFNLFTIRWCFPAMERMFQVQ